FPAFLRHFTNLLTTGDKKCHEIKKVVAVTGSLLPDGTTLALIVTQSPFPKSHVEKLCIEDVSKSTKSFDEIVDLNRDDNVVLSECISDLWAALTYYQSHPNRYMDLHTFVVYRSYRKLFKRIRQDTKTWNVHVAEKILAWKPKLNELRWDPRWFRVPYWWDSFVIPHEQLQTMNTRNRGTPGKELIEVEFSSATLSFWAWLLGSSLLHLENITETANKKRKNDNKGFKEDLVQIAEWCIVLHGYVNWSARIVETLLTGTSLANAFSLPASVQRDGNDRSTDDDNADDDDDDNADDDSADMSREMDESDGHLVLRHLRAMLAWTAALNSLTSRKHLSIISGKLDIGLVHVPRASRDIAGIEVITDEFFTRFPHRSVEESGRVRDTTYLQMYWKPEYSGTTHVEATLMGLLAYFSEPNPSSRVDYWNALQRDSKVAQRMEVLIGPTVGMADKVIGVGKKCCWCCSTLSSILSQDKHVSIKLPGSHGIVYPWSPPRVGLDVSVLEILEERLWAELHTAVEKGGSGISGSSSDDDDDDDDDDAPKEILLTYKVDLQSKVVYN
ncbi:hypothetical protein M405DRAFT_829631, partial [Rhizopogon salebrosus TDB-379]